MCKTWLRVCRSDERVLRGVAGYQDGLTKSGFMKLFATFLRRRLTRCPAQHTSDMGAAATFSTVETQSTRF